VPTIPRGGREYLRCPVTSNVALVDPPAVAFLARGEEVSATTTWVPGEWDGAAATDREGRSVRRLRVLVAAPDAPSGTPAGHPLAIGEYRSKLRVVDSPETVIREGTERIIVG
jgi:hypothetical protein